MLHHLMKHLMLQQSDAAFISSSSSPSAPSVQFSSEPNHNASMRFASERPNNQNLSAPSQVRGGRASESLQVFMSTGFESVRPIKACWQIDWSIFWQSSYVSTVVVLTGLEVQDETETVLQQQPIGRRLDFLTVGCGSHVQGLTGVEFWPVLIYSRVSDFIY